MHSRRVIGIALVVAGHATVVIWLLRHPDSARTYPVGERPARLAIDWLPRPLPPRDTRTGARRAVVASPPSHAILPPAERPVGQGASAAAGPPVDWARAASRAAEAAVAALPRAASDCDATPQPGSMRRPCGRRPEFGWSDNRRFGLAEGLLPYVRLGDACVVGLGFFGCRLGKAPPANAHLFDGLRDADRPQSSVPDVPH